MQKNYLKVSYITNDLIKFKKKMKCSKKNINNELKKIKIKLKNTYKIKFDYLEFRNVKDLKNSNLSKNKFRLFLAYKIGKIRLIDNF